MNQTPIIIDTDPGIDDAAAISMALNHPNIDVKMIATVNGNVNIDKTTANALKLKAFLNSDVPVYRGAEAPLNCALFDAAEVHGESGMDGYDFDPVDETQLASGHAIPAMRDVIMQSHTPITLVPIGPLTNIALLLKTYPEVKHNIKEIILMGGSTGRGNATPAAEFNIYCDPEAADIVFKSQLPITMVGLDVADSAMLTFDGLDRLRTLNRTGEMLHDLFRHYRGDDFDKGIKIYDAYTILYLLHPEDFNTVRAHVAIECDGRYTKGMTVVDMLSEAPNANVLLSMDESKFETRFFDTITYCQ